MMCIITWIELILPLSSSNVIKACSPFMHMLSFWLMVNSPLITSPPSCSWRCSKLMSTCGTFTRVWKRTRRMCHVCRLTFQAGGLPWSAPWIFPSVWQTGPSSSPVRPDISPVLWDVPVGVRSHSEFPSVKERVAFFLILSSAACVWSTDGCTTCTSSRRRVSSSFLIFSWTWTTTTINKSHFCGGTFGLCAHLSAREWSHYINTIIKMNTQD